MALVLFLCVAGVIQKCSFMPGPFQSVLCIYELCFYSCRMHSHWCLVLECVFSSKYVNALQKCTLFFIFGFMNNHVMNILVHIFRVTICFMPLVITNDVDTVCHAGVLSCYLVCQYSKSLGLLTCGV